MRRGIVWNLLVGFSDAPAVPWGTVVLIARRGMLLPLNARGDVGLGDVLYSRHSHCQAATGLMYAYGTRTVKIQYLHLVE